MRTQHYIYNLGLHQNQLTKMVMRFFIKIVKAHSSFSTDSSKVASLLQFYVYASMVS